MEQSLIGAWLGGTKRLFWDTKPGSMERFDEIIVMWRKPFHDPPLGPEEQDEVWRFMLGEILTQLKPHGRIIDLNKVDVSELKLGDKHGQTEPDNSDREGREVQGVWGSDQPPQSPPEA